MSQNFSLGDLVWAKMKGFPPWPGIIKEPPEELKAPKSKPGIHCVYFFGSKNYGWIKESCIKLYESNKKEMKKPAKSSALMAAVREIEDYMKNSHNKDEVLEKLRQETSTKKVNKKSEPCSIDDGSPSLSTQNGSFSDTPNRQTHVNYSSVPRPEIINQDIPELPPFDVNYVSEIVKNKKITPSELTFGFLSTGFIGASIIKNLVHTKHKVVIWTDLPNMNEPFKKLGVVILQTPRDVVSAADITFCCVSEENSVKKLVYGNYGVIFEMNPNKAFVEMSEIDPEASLDICNQVSSKGGKYLEVRFVGNRKAVEDGSLVVIAGGDPGVYRNCESCFQAMGINSKYVGTKIGTPAKMHSCIQLMQGAVAVGVDQIYDYIDHLGLDKSCFPLFAEHCSPGFPMLAEKILAIKDDNFYTDVQKGVKLALRLAGSYNLRLPHCSNVDMYINTKH